MKTALAALLAIATLLAPLPSARGQTLTVRGSDTLLDLSRKWAAAYQAKHAGTTFDVAGGGVNAAFTALADKKLDLALVARSLRYKEAEACVAAFGRRPAEYKVAVNGVAVYVNTNNPVTVLTYDELGSLFSGQCRTWKELDGGADLPVILYAQATNSVAGELFQDEVLNGKEMPGEVRRLTNPELLKALAGDPKGIGFGAPGPAEGVRPLRIKRVFSSRDVAPNDENLTQRTYPLSRFVFCYANPAANTNETKAYLDWIRSDEGQQIARAAGFFPVAAKWRTTP